jgi:hypothetical protein
MTVTADFTGSARWGAADEVIPGLISRPIASSVNIYGGAMAGVDASGNARQADDASCVQVLGLCLRQVLSTTAGTLVQMQRGAFTFNNGTGVDACSAATIGSSVYVQDANTAALTDTGGRLWAGTQIDWDSVTSRPVVALGMTYGQAIASVNPSTAFRARAVITSIDAYGGSGTNTLTETTASSGLGTQDGVTLVVGDVVFLEEGTTNITAAKDAGPYVVTNLGSASVKWVLTRPTWWETGVGIVPGAIIEVGGEGTLKGGTSWKSFVAKGKVIGTDAPLFWVGRLTQQITLSSGTFTITNVGIRSLTQTSAAIVRTLLNSSTMTTTVTYAVTSSNGAASGFTQGAINTGQAIVGAMVAAGTSVDASDNCKLNVTIINW